MNVLVQMGKSFLYEPWMPMKSICPLPRFVGAVDSLALPTARRSGAEGAGSMTAKGRLFRAVQALATLSAWSRSRHRSLGSSSPTESRTMLWVMPKDSSTSLGTLACVENALQKRRRLSPGGKLAPEELRT